MTNLHRSIYDSADAYVPLLAGAAFDRLFLESAYRRVTSHLALMHPEALRVLNFEAAYAKATKPVYPLLGRYDRIATLAAQGSAYDTKRLVILPKGHYTAAYAAKRLRQHFATVLAEVSLAT